MDVAYLALAAACWLAMVGMAVGCARLARATQ
jgi:hypothetical protein